MQKIATAIGLVVTMVLLSSCAGGAADDAALDPDNPTEATIQLGWQPNVESMAVIIAENKGYFEDEGLDIKILPGGPEVKHDAQIVSGNADMGILSSEALANAVTNEAPLIAIGAMYQKSPSAILSLDENGIDEPADLEGKNFGVSQIDRKIYTAFFETAGVDPEKVKMVDTGADPAALVSGEVDAMVSAMSNQPVALRVQGYETSEIPLSDYGYNRWTGGLTIRKESLEDQSQKAKVLAMTRAIERGLEDAVADPEGAGKLVFDEYGEDLGLVEETQIEGAKILADLTTAGERDEQLVVVDEDGVKSQQEFFDLTGIDGDAEQLFDVAASAEAFE